MQQISTPLPPSVPLCAAGHHPQLVETWGAPLGHRIGAPCPSMFHIECYRCGLATVPTPSRAMAESRWTHPTSQHRVPIAGLRRAREQACAALVLNGAAA